MNADAIRLSPDDNVATVLRAVAAGEVLQIRCGAELAALTAAEAIQMGHKVSTSPIGAGQAVVKYGHKIGEATATVGAGRHVHVHNMRSARARAPG